MLVLDFPHQAAEVAQIVIQGRGRKFKVVLADGRIDPHPLNQGVEITGHQGVLLLPEILAQDRVVDPGFRRDGYHQIVNHLAGAGQPVALFPLLVADLGRMLGFDPALVDDYPALAAGAVAAAGGVDVNPGGNRHPEQIFTVLENLESEVVGKKSNLVGWFGHGRRISFTCGRLVNLRTVKKRYMQVALNAKAGAGGNTPHTPVFQVCQPRPRPLAAGAAIFNIGVKRS